MKRDLLSPATLPHVYKLTPLKRSFNYRLHSSQLIKFPHEEKQVGFKWHIVEGKKGIQINSVFSCDIHTHNRVSNFKLIV